MQTIKSFTLVIIAFVVCHDVFSQSSVYKPFPQSYGNWSISEQSASGQNYYDYKTSGDTLIGTYTYKKVLYSYSLHNPFNFGPYAFNFAYRNDSVNKKVYYLDVTGGANTDMLWYDFNLNVGDTVPNTYSYGASFNKRVVQSIDSVLSCGSYHKRFNFNCTDNASCLIEGIGFMDHFIHSRRDNECPFEPVVVYYTGFSSCNITSVEDHAKNNTIKLFPNPANTELKMSTSLPVTEYTIVNNVGADVLKGNISGSQSINVATLANGLYSIKIQDRSGKYYQSKFIKQ